MKKPSIDRRPSPPSRDNVKPLQALESAPHLLQPQLWFFQRSDDMHQGSGGRPWMSSAEVLKQVFYPHLEALSRHLMKPASSQMQTKSSMCLLASRTKPGYHIAQTRSSTMLLNQITSLPSNFASLLMPFHSSPQIRSSLRSYCTTRPSQLQRPRNNNLDEDNV